MIVSITVTTGLGGSGDATPVDGTSPARAVAESAHASIKLIAKRFMLFSFEVEAMQDCL